MSFEPEFTKINLSSEMNKGKTIRDLINKIDDKIAEKESKAETRPKNQSAPKQEKRWYHHVADFFNSFKETDSRYNH